MIGLTSRTLSLAGAKSVGEVRQRSSALSKASQDEQTAKDVVTRFSALESTFTRSNESNSDHASGNSRRVVLDGKQTLSSAKRLGVNVAATLSLGTAGFLSKPGFLDGKVTGVAELNSEGKASSVDAEFHHVSPTGHTLDRSEKFRLTTAEDGTKTYELENMGYPRTKQTVQEKNGVLTLLEEKKQNSLPLGFSTSGLLTGKVHNSPWLAGTLSGTRNSVS